MQQESVALEIDGILHLVTARKVEPATAVAA